MRAATAKTKTAAEEVAVWAAMVAEETPFASGTFVDGLPERLTSTAGISLENDLVTAAAPGSVAAGTGAVAGTGGLVGHLSRHAKRHAWG